MSNLSILMPARWFATKDQDPLIDKFSNKLACAFCNGLKKGDRLEAKAAEFVDAYAGYIIDKSGQELDAGAKQGLLARINGMNPLVAAELLLAINYTGSTNGIAEEGFLDGLKLLNPYAASSLLYEIQITKNVEALTDSRLFTEHAVAFANSVNYEPLSEWYYSVAKTNNVADLTSAQAMGGGVIGAINADSRISSELSFLIGDSGKVSELTNSAFLNGLKGLEPAVAADYLSVMWCIDGGTRLANTETISRIALGQADVWRDIARINREGAADSQRILISNAGHKHDRGAKLLVRDLISAGYDVIYTGSISDHREIARVAQSEGVAAMGLSIIGITARQRWKSSRLVHKTLNDMQLNGSDAILFAGGIITQKMANNFVQSGVKVLTDIAKGGVYQEAGKADIVDFVSNAIKSRSNNTLQVGAHGFTMAYNTTAASYAATSTSLAQSAAIAGASVSFAAYTASALQSGLATQQYLACCDVAAADYNLSRKESSTECQYVYEMDVYGNVHLNLPMRLRLSYPKRQELVYIVKQAVKPATHQVASRNTKPEMRAMENIIFKYEPIPAAFSISAPVRAESSVAMQSIASKAIKTQNPAEKVTVSHTAANHIPMLHGIISPKLATLQSNAVNYATKYETVRQQHQSKGYGISITAQNKIKEHDPEVKVLHAYWALTTNDIKTAQESQCPALITAPEIASTAINITRPYVAIQGPKQINYEYPMGSGRLYQSNGIYIPESVTGKEWVRDRPNTYNEINKFQYSAILNMDAYPSTAISAEKYSPAESTGSEGKAQQARALYDPTKPMPYFQHNIPITSSSASNETAKSTLLKPHILGRSLTEPITATIGNVLPAAVLYSILR